ncbi:hypothetical protein BDZ89DRAFT_331012 [Hymenopellis radicata]|nr:hypothetical protein BDZ89DRAFT_331012 [Hymenopellis radicata]
MAAAPPSQYSAMPPPPQPPSPYTAVHPPAPRMHYSYQQPYVPHHMGYPPQEHWEHPHASVSSHPPPMSSHAPPTSSHPPPTSSHPPPTSSHPPSMSSHLPPASQPAPPSHSPVTHQAVHHAPVPQHPQPHPHPHSHPPPPPPSHHSTSSSLHPPPSHHTHHSSSSSLHPAPSHHAHHSTTPHHPVHQAPPAHHTPVSHHSQIQSQQHHPVAPHRTPTTHHTPPTSHHVHHSSAPHQPPQSPYESVPNHISAPVAVPPSSLHHHPPHTPHHTQQIHNHVPPPSNHLVHHQPPPHQQAPPPPPQPQSQPHQPQPQPAFPRTTALIPTQLDTRNSYPPPVPNNNGDALVREIVEQCSILYHFASPQMAQSPVQPSPTELADMMNRANRVVRLLEDLRRQVYPEGERARSSASSVRDDHRPPKRPWEDMSKENGITDQTENSPYLDNYKPPPDSMSVSTHPAQPIQSQPQQPPETPVPASTAEQDMELIRSKRAATTNAGVNGTPGQTKNKYRKRSRANPPGKCHSCNIRETPEWRRGPDGARTLCNACGLHYAKLMRKQERHHGANAPGIDMETLRASARAADQDKVRAAANKQAAKRKAEVGDASPDQKPAAQPLPAQSHHQGSFQVMPPPGTQHPPPPQPAQPPPPQQQMTPQSQPAVPPPPWAANGRAYAPEQMPSSSQSFIRTPSHPSQSTSAR